METPAMKRVMRARSALIYSHAFFGVLSLNLVLIETTQIKTLATNGKELLFNSTCVAGMSDGHLLFGIAHEVMHCALFHPVRRGSRDPHLWNIACDYVVNAHLKRAGFDLPTWVYYDPQYDGLSAEEVYRLLDHQRKQQQQPDESTDQGDGNEQAQQDAGEPDQADSDDEGKADGNADDVDQDSGGDGGDQDGDASQDATESGDEHHGNGSSSGSGRLPLNDDGKLEDQVLDAAPDSPGEQAEIQADWDQMTRQAVNVSRARGAGHIPGWLTTIADASAKSVIDWREVLRRFVSQSSTTRLTWNRPNRRLIGSGIYMPGSVSDGVNHIVWVADTSGSMSDQALSACKAELQAALDEGAIDRLTVLSCDSRVHNAAEFQRGDVIDFQFKGRGGTRFSPAFKWIEENASDAAGVIYFSDLETIDWGNEPQCPVLWAAYGDPRSLPTLIDKAPFGEAIVIEW